jgi:hypothetical protein
MERTRRPLTDEQKARAEARRAQFRALAEKVSRMTDDERAAMAERMAGAMTIEGHPLSLHNRCLIACQYPTATLVGGFRQWQQHGRVVRKGEHGLMIWAPVRDGRAPAPATTPDVGELDREKPRYIMVTVFDVSQTTDDRRGEP